MQLALASQQLRALLALKRMQVSKSVYFYYNLIINYLNKERKKHLFSTINIALSVNCPKLQN